MLQRHLKLEKIIEKQPVILFFLLFCMVFLSGCSVWQEDFETKPVRGMPKASIHEISTMVDNGIIKEDDVQGNVSTIKLNSGKIESSQTSFSDGNISRGHEKVQRIYLASYEDENKNLHGSHNLYVVVKPATWSFERETK